MSIDCTLDRLADHHLDLLGLEWRRRALLLDSPVATTADLEGWDDRLAASMEALDHLAPAVEALIRRRLNEPVNAGEMFAMLTFALRTGHDELLAAGAGLARSLPRFEPALIAAIEWAPRTDLLDRFIDALPLRLRFDVMASRWRDRPHLQGGMLRLLPLDEIEPGLLHAALRFAGWRADRSLEQALSSHGLVHPDVRTRCAAADLALASPANELHRQAVDVLGEIVEHTPALREHAVRSLALHRAADVASRWMHALERAGETRLSIRATSWRGDLKAVPRLIDHLEEPASARVAGAALSLLTGSDPVRDAWQADEAPPLSSLRPDDATTSTITPPDPDAGLPWPSRQKFVAWWERARSAFSTDHVLIGGQLSTQQRLSEVIRRGPLAWRPLAATRLQRLTGQALFPTHLPSAQQRALFDTLG